MGDLGCAVGLEDHLITILIYFYGILLQGASNRKHNRSSNENIYNDSVFNTIVFQ
jgi:hypothetical protein